MCSTDDRKINRFINKQIDKIGRRVDQISRHSRNDIMYSTDDRKIDRFIDKQLDKIGR